MRTLLTSFLLVTGLYTNAQLYIDGTPVLEDAQYITAVFHTKALVAEMEVHVNDGERRGTLTDASGVPVKFNGPAQLFNTMYKLGWVFAGSADAYYTSGKGITASTLQAFNVGTLFTRR